MKNYNLKNAFKLQRIPKLLLLFMSVLFLSACVEGTTTSPSPNPPVFTGGGTANATINVAANSTATGYTAAATDSDGDSLTYSLSGGSDQALFVIDANSGELSFLVIPDFDAPTDSDNNNSYEVEISVSDGSNTTVQRVTIIVSNDNENSAPVFTSGTSLSVLENTTTTGYTATATDADGDTLTFSLSGGVDLSVFSIDSISGVLSFQAAVDFETPSDSDTNNTYIVEISVNDGSNSVEQKVTVIVSNNGNENPPVFTSGVAVSMAENNIATGYSATATDVDGNTLTFSLSGGADQSAFSIDSISGVLSFHAAVDFEAPSDADTNNTYIVEINVNDGSNFVKQSIVVTVVDVNDDLVAAVPQYMLVDSSVSLNASGGASPYNFSLVSGEGSLNSTSGMFIAPSTAQSVSIIVTDSVGKTASVNLSIYQALSLESSSITITKHSNKIHRYLATGGLEH